MRRRYFDHFVPTSKNKRFFLKTLKFEQKAKKKIEAERGPRLPLYCIYECDDFKRKFFLFIYISKAMEIHFRSEMVMMRAKLTR